MQSMKKLQSFYKAQTARNPWAIATAIVNGPADGKPAGKHLSDVRALYEEKIAGAKSEKAKKSLIASIAAGIERNEFNNSVDDETAAQLDGLFKGTVNGKKFSYDEDGHQEAIDYATELMEKKKPVDFEWHEEKSIQKISPAMGALAGWWLGGTMQDIARGHSQPTPAQQREFERQIQQAMRQKGRKMTKESAMEKMQSFFQKDDSDTYVRKTPVSNAVQAEEDILQKIVSFPPFAGARFDPTSHRWVQPKNYGQTHHARGGKKRIRASGTGAHERAVSGHGKGRIRGEGAGAKGKSETHLAASRRKEGFTHAKRKQS